MQNAVEKKFVDKVGALKIFFLLDGLPWYAS